MFGCAVTSLEDADGARQRPCTNEALLVEVEKRICRRAASRKRRFACVLS